MRAGTKVNMLSKTKVSRASLLLAVFLSFGAETNVGAQDAGWRVSKSSGDVWIATSSAQPAALSNDAVVKPGDTIRTGQNGRVLLLRGQESILISANSVVGIPANKSEGFSTTIVQQAGSILLDVEKRNVQHFEVATPYLAAVVKGTQFRVIVDNSGSRVDVLSGQVQVTDYKTGQYAIVKPSQMAAVSLQGTSGLSLSGSGTLNPIQQGTPRNSSVSPLSVPSEGLSAPSQMKNERQARAPAEENSAQSAPVSADGRSKEYGWTSRVAVWGKVALGLDETKNRDERIVRTLAVPAAIGFSVAVGAGVVRLRKRRKQNPGDR
jgi:hypothetical protein